MNQIDMMESDKLILVDEYDRMIVDTTASSIVDPPSMCSKKAGHSFSLQQPRGILHRAFSLFCFNQEGKLLLTQRANSKITFPSVWTNTACSHPLQDMIPSEVDDDFDKDFPNFPGVKHAALRKAKHELGLDLLPYLHSIQFVSRFHYWAADVPTHGIHSPWGEHEIDYILFVQIPKPTFDLTLNPEEVSQIKYVTINELKDMMYAKPSSSSSQQHHTLCWSPWFVGIMERGGFEWWKDLQRTLQGHYTNTNIEFFDPSPTHMASYNSPNHTKTTGVFHPSSSSSIPSPTVMSAAEKLASTEPTRWVRIT